ENLCARRTGGRDRETRPRELQTPRDEIGDGKNILRRAVLEPVRQFIRRDIALAIGQFRLLYARRARTDEDTDAMRAVLVAAASRGCGESILPKRELGKPIVATVPLGPFTGQRPIEILDLAQPAFERVRIESELAQTAAARLQSVEMRFASRAERG